MRKKGRGRHLEKKDDSQSSPVGVRPVLASQPWNRNISLWFILITSFVVFANTLFSGFAYDDQTQILENQLIRSFSNIPTAFTKEVWFWRVLQDKDPTKETGPTTPYYRPVFTLYLMIAWHLFGDQPAGWHVINVLMHLLAVYLAFLILEKLTKDLKIATLATLLFALHPLRTESVAWISGVTDLFLALFLLPSFYFYLVFRERGGWKNFAASMGFFVLAAFSKEPAAAMPLLVAAHELFMLNSEIGWRHRVRNGAIYSAGYFLVIACISVRVTTLLVSCLTTPTTYPIRRSKLYSRSRLSFVSISACCSGQSGRRISRSFMQPRW